MAKQGKALPVPASDEGRGLTLYELTGQYAEIATLLDRDLDADELGIDDLNEILDTMRPEIIAKGENLGRVIRQKEAEVEWIEAQAAAFRREADRIIMRAGVKERGVERLRAFLTDAMGVIGDGTQKVEGGLVNITLSKRGDDVLEVTDETKIPEAYIIATAQGPASNVRHLPDGWTVKSTRVDKAALNEAWKESHIAHAGTTIVPKKRSLKVY